MIDRSLPSLESRIQQSLRRQGYYNVGITHLGEGNIKVSTNGADRDDQCVIKAIATTVTGVVSVELE
ncbi:hypothetical protein [Roseimaritima sediminicola]|uniref:hypothetical protein n=1 Tax=Roseimaritima sediminicola TaxID=2662066 RepID=UPI0012982867|nr:hypothetical protein [Roseimaritima sediminicola]